MKISLVIPNLNYGEYLEACLSSVAAQTHRELEVILIDGGSIDHSQQVFQTFAAQYGWKFFVRPNESQAAAIAWGLAHTTGEVQGWLNSDDLFLTARALETVVGEFQNRPALDIFSAGGYYVDRAGHYLRPCKLQAHPLFQQTRLSLRGGLVQPASFWRRRVFESIGFDASLRYSFDTDFFIRAAEQFNLLIDQNLFLSGYRLHGANLSTGIKVERVQELVRMARKRNDSFYRRSHLRMIWLLLRLLDILPPALALSLKQAVYAANNFLSYVTVYRIPSI